MFASLFGLVLWLVYLVFDANTGHARERPTTESQNTQRFDAAGADGPTVSVEAIGQVVPAIVIAVFVFGVGTAFVVAQVVPPARGARAVDFLQGRRFGLTITPALALVAGSALLLGLPEDRYDDREALAFALLVGSVVYVVGATAALLSIYRDATDPRMFRRLVARKQRPPRSVRMEEGMQASIVWLDRHLDRWRRAHEQKRHNYVEMPAQQQEDERDDHRKDRADDDVGGCDDAEGESPVCLRRYEASNDVQALQAQRAADRLYTLVRTTRGWARVAANTGDSRELHEALECMIELVIQYSRPRFGVKRSKVGRTYPVVRPSLFGADPINPRGVLWSVPNDECGGTARQAHNCVVQRSTYRAWADQSLPDTWFANEVGRALVRAAEYGLRTGSLLDRDLLRMLNTLVLCIEEIAEPPPHAAPDFDEEMEARSLAAGVLVRYLVEIGMTVRWSSPEQVEWFYAPAIHLGRLSGTLNNRELKFGCLAGLLLVVDCLLSREDEAAQLTAQRGPEPDQASKSDPQQQDGAPVSASRENPIKATLNTHGVVLRLPWEDRNEVVCLARSSILRPEERPVVNESDAGRLVEILDGLIN